MKQTIESLSKEVGYWKEKYSRVEADLATFFKAIRDGVGGVGSESRESLIQRVSSNTAFLRRIEGMEVDIKKENSRLWYMMRVVMKDPQLDHKETDRHELIPLNTGKDEFPH